MLKLKTTLPVGSSAFLARLAEIFHRIFDAADLDVSPLSHPFVGWYEDEERHAAVVKWLERSEPLPLALSVNCGAQNPKKHPRFTPLLPFSGRWHSRLHISALWILEFLQNLVSVDAPLLADIVITLEDGDPADMSLVLSSNLF
jgi:hypothetical protein